MGNHRSRLLWLYFKSKGSAIKTHNWEENAAPLIREVGPPAIYPPAFIKNKIRKREKSRKKMPHLYPPLISFQITGVLQTACQMKCIKRCSLGGIKGKDALASWSLWIYSEQTVCRLTTCTESSPAPSQWNDKPLQTRGLMQSLTASYCIKQSHKDPQGLLSYKDWTLNSPASDHDWLIKKGPGTQTSQQKDTFTKMHQTMWQSIRKEKLLNFLEIQVHLRKAPSFSLKPKMEKGSDQAATLRSQVWIGKNTRREGWAGAGKGVHQKVLTTTCSVTLNAN